MSQTQEKKSRFQVSREVQEEFVNGIAEAMLALTSKAAGKPHVADTPTGTPFCPTSGREYGGPNMLRLMLAGMEKGYSDDRWLTFKQVRQYQSEHPNLKVGIKKGEHGVKLLRPEEVFFTIGEDKKWTFHSQEEARAIEAQRRQGAKLPPVQHKTLFYPFTVFNAEQISGLPAKEKEAPALTEQERNAFLEKFIADSGVTVEHHEGPAAYSHAEDVMKMPFPDTFTSSDAYYAAKLRGFYEATGHSSRENRQAEPETLKSRAFEEMRAELFSLLAGAKFNLPMPDNSASAQVANWNQKFSGGDVAELFKAAADAARTLTSLRQFEAGEKPRDWWFPRPEAWPELEAMQKQRDAVTGVSFRENAFSGTPRPVPGEAAPQSLAKSARAFDKTDDLTVKARLILQNPDFLNMALMLDPSASRELAALCDQVSQTLHMELDARLQSAPGAVENPLPLNEQKAASARRMRM